MTLLAVLHVRNWFSVSHGNFIYLLIVVKMVLIVVFVVVIAVLVVLILTVSKPQLVFSVSYSLLCTNSLLLLDFSNMACLFQLGSMLSGFPFGKLPFVLNLLNVLISFLSMLLET